MPYLLMFLGVLLFGFGFWMLQNQKAKPEPARLEQVQTEKPEVKLGKPAELSNHEKGLAFEKFVVSRFNKEYFALKQWQGDKFHKGRFAEANQHPDLLLEFQLKDVKEQFAVECKWRSHLSFPFEWAEARQIENYLKFQSEMQLPVFVVLGIGGTPSEPESVYVAALPDLKEPKLNRELLASLKREEPNRFFFYDAKKNALR